MYITNENKRILLILPEDIGGNGVRIKTRNDKTKAVYLNYGLI